jgi:hypothetical protein
MAIEKDGKGRKVFVQREGENVPPPGEKMSELVIKEKLNVPFSGDIDFPVILETLLVGITNEKSLVRATGEVLLTSYNSLTQLNNQLSQIQQDGTKTIASKMLAKESLATPYFEDVTKSIARLDLAIRDELTSLSGQLFSNDTVLSPLEQALLPTYAGRLRGEDSIEISGLLESESEARIALALARDFSNLIPDNDIDNSFKTLSRMANDIHTKEAQTSVNEIENLFSEMHGLISIFRQHRADYLDKDILDQIKLNVIGA